MEHSGKDEEDSESEDEQEKLEEVKVDYGKMYWFKEDNAYAYSSGMRYKVQNKSYTTWVTDYPDDFGYLHYLPF